MASRWEEFKSEQPELARRAEERFGAFRHHVLATLHKDGSPRLSGIEVNFGHGELWLGMMYDSLKAKDLGRDPRFALHANPGADPEAGDGDVKIGGHAIEEKDPEALARFISELSPPEPFRLFRVGLSAVVRTYVDGRRLMIESWSPGRGLRVVGVA